MSKHTFVSLYEERCKLDDEEPVNKEAYLDLDKVMTYIEKEDKETKPLKEAVMMTNGFRLVPYDKHSEQRLPPYVVVEDTPMALSNPDLDKYTTEVIDQLDSSNGVEFFEDQKSFLLWKIRKLGKVLSMGWEDYAKLYLQAE